MYISELKIHGFKSFADKVSLKFGEGVTGIVGPNGCGKTNIVDAIRWVLGEQKYSVLRSGKMEDVIFNGAADRKPLGVCEVFLTVHNQGKLPVEYSDIEIGRRIYRNGESEYFLNRQVCRLKDIQDLFIDTGMGADAYSVIELKMVEQILSDSGEDRKRMFEEAAGINKYKHQRKSALRKFDATHQDLERIKDILAEVESKVHGLGLQLKRFKRHAKLMEDLKNKDLALAWLRINRYQETAAPLKEKIQEYRSLRESGTASQRKFEEEQATLKERYQEIEKTLSQEQEALSELETRRLEKEQNILVWREQIRSHTQTIARLTSEFEKNTHRLESIDSTVKTLDDQIQKLEPETETKLREYETQKTAYDEVETRYREVRKIEEDIQSRRWERQKALSSQQSLLSRTETLLEEKQNRLTQVETRLKEMESTAEQEVNERNQLEGRKETLDTQLATARQEFESQEARLEQVRSQVSDLTSQRQQLQTRQSALETQRDFFQELIASGEGHPEGTRYILEHVDDFPGVLGGLGDQIGVPDDLQTATEAALGAFAHYLVVDSRDHARNVLALARKHAIGEFGLMTLEGLPNVPEPPTPPANADKRLLDQLDVSDTLRPLLELLIGSAWLVPSVAEVPDKHRSDGLFLDREGGRLERGAIWYQTGSARDGSLIGRQQRIDALNNELASIAQSLGALDRQETDLTAQVAELSRTTREAGEHVDGLRRESNTVEEALLKLHYQHTRTLEQAKELRTSKGELEKEIADLKEALDRLKPELAAGEAHLQSIQDDLQNAQEKLASIRAERDRVNTRSQELRIELINLENQRENLEMQKRSALENREELRHRNERIDAEKKELRETIATLERDVAETESTLEALRKDIEARKSKVSDIQRTRDQVYEKLETIRQLIQDEQKTREALLEDLRESELKVSEIQQRIEILREHIRDQYNLTVPEHLEVTEDEDTLERDIERTKRSIENIGPVNMAVQAEYEEENERLQLLITQREDLIEAESNLRETIQRIDRIARKQFLEAFDQIKANYERLFPIFFEGGKGTLSLVGDPDPLEADIAISAQPPGKRNQTLRMLSAGEKSLTAIALLFAIYQHKPSPYCILDEVDAPLDDGNIRKFTNVLKKFSDETQFIVVTHNKLTMEGANVLYGVTMEKKGISKLVSVSLN